MSNIALLLHRMATGSGWVHRDDLAETLGGSLVPDSKDKSLFNVWRRQRQRERANQSILSPVRDSVLAATIMMVATALQRGPLLSSTRDLIRAQLFGIAGDRNLDDVLAEALTITEVARDPDLVSLRFAALWLDTLDLEGRHELLAMVSLIALQGDGPDRRQAASLALLARRLELG